MQFGPVNPADVMPPHLNAAGAVVYAAVFLLVAWATRKKAVYGLLALVLLDPFAFYQSIGPTTLTLSKIALAGTLAGLFLRKTRAKTLSIAPVRQLAIAVLLVAAAIAISAAHASFLFPVMRETLKWFEYAVILGVAAVAFYEDPDEQLLRWAVLIVTAAVVALAIPELYVGAHAGIVLSHTEVPRIAGPLEGPNQLAAYLGLMLPLILAYTLLRGRRWPEIFVLVVGIVATLMTLSRGGIVALAIALLLVAMSCARSRTARMMFAALAVGALAAAAAGWRQVAGGIGLITPAPHHHVEIHGGLGTRRDLWAAAFRLWLAHPIWGIGAGNYELEVGKLLHAPIKTHTNSFYLQSLVEGGIPLFAATVYLVYTTIASFVRRAQTPLATAVLAGSIALALHFVLDLLVFYPKVGGMWMMLLGIAGADAARQLTQRATDPSSADRTGNRRADSLPASP